MSEAPLITTPAPRVPRETFEAVVWSGLAICTIALAFRCYVRFRVFCRLQVEDFITIFAWTMLLATALIWNQTLDGLYELALVSSGAKMPDEDFAETASKHLKASAAAKVMFYLGLWTIKMNFLIIFYPLGASITRYRVCWWIVTVFTICVGLSLFGVIPYQCMVSSFDYIEKHCASTSTIKFQKLTLKLNCAWDVITDALIVMFPIWILHNVRISLQRKLILGATFSLVLITMTVAIVRVIIVGDNNDITQQIDMTSLYMWCYIESSVALLIACLASFRTLFAQKEKEAKAREIEERERAQRGPFGAVGSSVQRARWKYFQGSLFDTASDDKTLKDTTYDIDLPLQKHDSATGGMHPLRTHNISFDSSSTV